MNEERMIKNTDAIVSRYGKNDYVIWFLDLPKDMEVTYRDLISKYGNRGCSVRGTRNDIIEELRS